MQKQHASHSWYGGKSQEDNYQAFGLTKVVSGGTSNYLYNSMELQETGAI